MFEAIEAITGEDIRTKFLPVILKYNIADEVFDENFVFKAIENLTTKIEEFESRIITHKAYELSAKLDKLNFIKSNLPKVYIRMQENIYPEFNYWDQGTIKVNLEKIILYIKPGTTVNIGTLNLVNEIFKAKRIDQHSDELPYIKWSVFIGKQKWKNTPLVLGNEIFVGSAGTKWNESDEMDGVYCINALSGHIKWFYPTNSDVNEVTYYDGTILTGCDSGLVICLSAKDGKLKWEKQMESGIVSKILKDTDFDSESFIAITYNGLVIFLDTKTGKTQYQLQINGHIIGTPRHIKKSYHSLLYIQTMEGVIYKLAKQYNNFEVIDNYPLHYPDQYSSETGYSSPQLYSTPIIDDHFIYVGYGRHTYYNSPPILCYDEETKEIVWYTSSDNTADSFGNIRSNLAVYRDEIIFVHSYSNQLVAVSKTDGKVSWMIELGRTMFQQWATPVIDGDSIFIARYDGYLYKVNGQTKQREWAIYIGENKDSGTVFEKGQELSNIDETTVWELYKGFPLLSTPSI
jgi:outer membrane protein assembly factor BamB